MSFDVSACPDGQLARLSRAGDERAFAELVRRHKEPIYRLARSCTGDADEALDIVQDAFVAAHGALRRYDPERSFRAWLARIALNKCRDWSRRRAVRRLFSLPGLTADQAAEYADPTPGVEQEAADRQELARLEQGIAALPRALREVLVLRTIEGLSQAETADALGVTEKAVETRLYRARAKLGDVRGKGR